jgi:hypothetical protein
MFKKKKRKESVCSNDMGTVALLYLGACFWGNKYQACKATG